MSIVDLLWQIHNHPGAGHENQLDAADIGFADGQRQQLQLLDRWLAQGETIGGWKIGMTSGANRNAMGDGIRPFGFILENRILSSGTILKLADLYRGQVENELCLIMGSPLGAGATRDQAIDSVSHISPAFEINQKRLPAGVSPGVRVADDLSNWGVVVGRPVAVSKPLLDSLENMTVTLSNAHGEIESVSSKDHIDDHFESLAILANTLAEYGQRLLPGQRIITGAYGKTPFAAGTYTGDFALADNTLGRVKVSLV